MVTDTATIEKLTRTFESANTRFVVTAELKPVNPVAPYLSIDLLPIKYGDGKALSITGIVYERSNAGVWRDVWFGQCKEELRAAFPGDPTVTRLCDIWDAYHLCDMEAGSREQNAIIDEWRKQMTPDPTLGPHGYERVCELLRQAGKLEVPIPNQYESVYFVRPHYQPNEIGYYAQAGKLYNTPEEAEASRAGNPAQAYYKLVAVPKMYRYGSAWLCSTLPPEVEAELRQLMTPPQAPPLAPEVENRNRYAALGISMSVQRADRNPSMDDFEGDHWKCILSRRQDSGRPRRMTVYFTKGYGHGGKEPTLDEIMETLAQDAASVENCGDFAGFCGEYGYDEDSRSAERTWNAMAHQAERFKNFLGSELFETFLKS